MPGVVAGAMLVFIPAVGDIAQGVMNRSAWAPGSAARISATRAAAGDVTRKGMVSLMPHI